MDLDITWKALFHDYGEFDYNKYLYHYTTFETILKILESQEIRFSRITCTNDPIESKMNIHYADHSDITNAKGKIQAISDYFKDNRDIVRLACFSVDTELSEDIKEKYRHNNESYRNVLGRGFALPRMWAQYSDNNKGVCLVIDKAKFEEYVHKKYTFSMCQKVSYDDFFKKYSIGSSEIEQLYNQVQNPSNGVFTLQNLVTNSKNDEFLKFNFFSKLNDWANEFEYRCIVIVQNPDVEHISVDSLCDYLEGIVIGEHMPNAFARAICSAANKLDKKHRIKRINFSHNGCRVKDVF